MDTFRDLLTNIYGEKDGKLKWIEYGKPFLQLMGKAAKASKVFFIHMHASHSFHSDPSNESFRE